MGLNPCALAKRRYDEAENPQKKRLRAIDLVICKLEQVNSILTDATDPDRQTTIDGNLASINDLNVKKAALEATNAAFLPIAQKKLDALATAVSALETAVAQSARANALAQAGKDLVTAIKPLIT
jgi:hypothetical protein